MSDEKRCYGCGKFDVKNKKPILCPGKTWGSFALQQSWICRDCSFLIAEKYIIGTLYKDEIRRTRS